MIPSGDLVPALQREFGNLYFPLDVPPGTYPGVTTAVPVVGVANVLVVNRAMPDDLAYQITKAIFEHQPELAAIHPEARNLSSTTATTGSPAEFHPGAKKYFDERQ